MTPQEITKLIVDVGAGIGALSLVGYGVYRFILFISAMGDLAVKFMENHAVHYQDSLERMASGIESSVKLTEDANKKLDAQSQMLGLIVSQTKPKDPV